MTIPIDDPSANGPHIAAFQQGQKLAAFLDDEFRRGGVDNPVWIHAFAILYAAWMVDSDNRMSMLEQQERRLLTDADKIKMLTNEITELVEIGRSQAHKTITATKEMNDAGPKSPKPN